MDIIALAPIDKVIEVFRSLGFRIENKGSYYSATLHKGLGKFHALIVSLSNDELLRKIPKLKIPGANTEIAYIDLHWDYIIHLLFLGVDYKRKPRELYLTILKKELERAKIEHFIIGGSNWWSRVNKAILRGLKL